MQLLSKKSLLSVIVPVRKGEDLTPILSSLIFLPEDTEILFISSREIHPPKNKLWEKIEYSYKVKFLQSKDGRAQAMNFGAQKAENMFLWFLHLDSRFGKKLVQSLIKKIALYPNRLIFFNLKFRHKGTKLTYINNICTWFRSRVLRLPFGDQGFCLSKENFKLLKKYNEKVRYGEDHLFIWQAHIKKIKIICAGESISSSNEKYRNGNWLKTTVLYQKIWISQAISQLFHLLKRILRLK